MTKAQLLAYIQAHLVDNISEQILPSHVRTICDELAKLTSENIVIPTLSVSHTGGQIYLRWSAIDQKFLDYQPTICLFRYRQRRASKKKDLTGFKVKHKTPSRWTHPVNSDFDNTGRTTEFALPAAGSATVVELDYSQWFRQMPVDDEGHYRLIPKGVKSSTGEDIRKNMFIAFAVQITVNGQKYYGALSHVLKVGYTRIRKSEGTDITVYAGGAINENYLPVIQFV